MKPIFLVGYMGCGKSTLGRKLARSLCVPFFDTDALIEERAGASVCDIFQFEGEKRFREMEHEVLQQIIGRGDACVVSTGGGLPVWGDNMALMNAAGHTFYLRRTPEQIVARLSPYGRQKRPKLRGLSDGELVGFMTRDMAGREQFYSQAHTTIDCAALPDRTLIECILTQTENDR